MKTSKLLLLGMLIAAMVVPATVIADEVPSGCSGASISLDPARSPSIAHVGDTITYTVQAHQVGTCEIWDVTMRWQPPGSVVWVDLIGGSGDPPVDLGVGGSTVLYTMTHVVQLGDIEPDGKIYAYFEAYGVVQNDPLGPGSNTFDEDSTPVTIISEPDTEVGITVTDPLGPVGHPTNLIVTETNTGLDPLTDVTVTVSSVPGTTGLPIVLGYPTNPPDSGDPVTPGTQGVLDVGETWTWNIGPYPVAALTTYTVVGYGVDPLGDPVTIPDYPLEEATAEADVVPEPCVEVTKEVDCDISKAGDTVTYHYCIHNCGPLEIEIVDWIDTVVDREVIGAALEAAGCDILAPDDLAPGGPDECCFDVDFVIPEDDPFGDPIVNGFAVLAQDTQYDQFTDSGELVMAEVDIVHPSFIATKDCRTDDLAVGDTAIFDIRIENDGDVCLRFDLTELGAPVQFDLAAGDVEEWETHILVETEEDITNTIIGTAILIPGSTPEECGEPTDCLDNILPVEASDTCEVGGGASRTPGYWKTHTYMAECMFDMCYPDGINFGWTYVDSIEELMAIFHAKKAKLNKLCQARLQLSFHMGAAILNNCLPNGLPFESHTGETFAGLAAIMADCDVAAIKAKIGIVGGYNEYGDDVEIIWPEGMCDDLIAYNATPKVSKEWAATVNLATLMGECETCGTATATGKGKNK